MVAISQAPSPESNPNSPLPVKGKVVNYTTFNLIGGKFVQQRVHANAFATFACLNSVSCRKRRWFLFRRSAPHTTRRQTKFTSLLGKCGVFRTGISFAVSKVIPRAGKCTSFVGETINRLMSRTQTSRGKPRVLSHLHGLVLETSI